MQFAIIISHSLIPKGFGGFDELWFGMTELNKYLADGCKVVSMSALGGGITTRNDCLVVLEK